MSLGIARKLGHFILRGLVEISESCLTLEPARIVLDSVPSIAESPPVLLLKELGVGRLECFILKGTWEVDVDILLHFVSAKRLTWLPKKIERRLTEDRLWPRWWPSCESESPHNSYTDRW